MKKIIFKGVASKDQISWGCHTDPDGILVEGRIYDVDYIEAHTQHTKVFLKDIEGDFNTLWFEDIAV